MRDDELQRRFDELDDIDVPPWRAATEERLARTTGAVVPEARPRLLLPAAVVLVLALVGIGVVWAGTSDGGQDDAVVAGPGDPSEPAPPVPLDDRLLVCPPALLDISGLEVQPTLAPGEATLVPEGVEVGAEPYQLTWEENGVEMRLSYPPPFLMTADLPPSETVELADGRSVRLEYRTDTTAYVTPAVGEGQCSSFWVSVPGDSRDAALAIAEQVVVRVPEGTTTVPDVVGLGPLEAQDALARAGLVPAGEPIEYFRLEPEQAVSTQSPAAGVEVPFGSEVVLVREPPPTTTSPPTQELNGAEVPVPEDPIVCPYARMEVDDVVISQPRVAYGTTIEWDQPDGYLVVLRWPGPDVANGNFRDLTIQGRAARMYDGGDGQNLVYDTGLTDGPCRFVELSVYGGPSIPERERRAEALAEDGITFPPIPDQAPPDVVGSSVADAADVLARAGFIPDWGARPQLPGADDDPTGGPVPPADEVVTGQRVTGDHVVILTTG